MSPDLQGKAISALAGFLITESTFSETMHRLVEVAREAVVSADIAGLTILDADLGPSSPYYTDEASPHVEEVQYAANRGPCIDAHERREPVRVAHLELVEDRYPEFVASATTCGIRSALIVPLLPSDMEIGTLNLYSTRPDAFGPSDEEAARQVAGPIGAAIANAAAYWNVYDLSLQLQEALRSRAIIEQAKGVIMATARCGPDEAFELLRQQSQHENRKLREIAQELVERQQRP